MRRIALALWLMPAGAFAEPNPSCPGTCDGAPQTACGEAADCGGGACLIDDACLPGGAFAVTRVVPESVAQLNDFALWRLEGTPEIVVEDGALTARLPESFAASYFARDVALTPGSRYAVRALMRRDPDADGYLVAYTDGRADYSDPLTATARRSRAPIRAVTCKAASPSPPTTMGARR